MNPLFNLGHNFSLLDRELSFSTIFLEIPGDPIDSRQSVVFSPQRTEPDPRKLRKCLTEFETHLAIQELPLFQ
jgi:hypothetical protein